MRLNKMLAYSLGVSRREADDLIAAKRVRVGGDVARLGQTVEDSADTEITLDGKPIPKRAGYTYVVLNKPAGYVSSRKRQGERQTLYELLPEEFRSLKTVGRLDADSSGLILLTDDGDFAFEMTHPRFAKTKVYEAGLDRPLTPLHQQMIADLGLELPDGKSKLGLERLGDSGKSWRVTMQEGRNRQIRRTFGALEYTVVALHRTHFGRYDLGDLEPGEYCKTSR